MEDSLAVGTHFEDDFHEFKRRLDSHGLEGALRFLSGRTPHRFTGIYQYAGNTLLNLVLFDSVEDVLKKGGASPLENTFCSLVKDTKQQVLEINDAAQDERVKGKVITPVVSYCGVLMKNEAGGSFGTLCHFDMQRCQERAYDLPLLKAASVLLYNHLVSDGTIVMN